MEHEIAKEQMRGKWASSCVDFGYTDRFCIPELISEFISSCDSVLGDSLVFYQENRGSYVFNWKYDIALHEMQGNQASSPGEGYVSWGFSSCGGILGYILELQRGWPFETPLCSAKSGLLSSYDGHHRKVN